MGRVNFLVHVPLLRIRPERAAFCAGSLWRMDFDTYNTLTRGAFSDHQAAYEETAPVFFTFGMNLGSDDGLVTGSERPDGVIEQKLRSDDIRSWIMPPFGWRHAAMCVAEQAWRCLLLGVPAAKLPVPRLSVAFAVPHDASEFFDLGHERGRCLRVQGDADQEYLFLSEAAVNPLDESVITTADGMQSTLAGVETHPELRDALAVLESSAALTLGPADQLVLDSIGLEALLLPEVRSGLGATFSRRLSSLLARTPQARTQLEAIGRQLYHFRSAGVHGEHPSWREHAQEAIDHGVASQLLGASIIALADRAANGEQLDVARKSLDHPPPAPGAGDAPHLPANNPPGRCPPNRMARRTPRIAFSMSSESGMGSEPGQLLSWSPLVDLGMTSPGATVEQTLVLSRRARALLIPLTGSEVISIEEKDIRRDFIAQLHVMSHPIAALAITNDLPDGADRETVSSKLVRTRDLGVTALRMEGFTGFRDPELLGAYIYEGFVRFRVPTVLRQTLLVCMRSEPAERISPEQARSAAATMDTLLSYDETCPDAEVDQVLTMYRRACDTRFLPARARAGLMFGALEAMLGRMRPKRDRLQLHHFVSGLAGARAPDAAAWFAAQGRGFRNQVAHGARTPEGMDNAVDEPLTHLLHILSAIVPEFVATWVHAPDRAELRPGALFVRDVSRRIGAAAGARGGAA